GLIRVVEPRAQGAHRTEIERVLRADIALPFRRELRDGIERRSGGVPYGIVRRATQIEILVVQIADGGIERERLCRAPFELHFHAVDARLTHALSELCREPRAGIDRR